MALSIERVRVKDFRSYESFEMDLDPSLTILVGPNASGKTNLVEAIELLTRAASFRAPSWADTVREGAVGSARLSLMATGSNRSLEVELEITRSSRRSYRVNGKPRRAVNQVAGVLPCVVFTPDDLRLVKDAAETRRAALDALGSQLSPTYARLKTDYDKILRQRNVLLREEARDEDLIPWTERLTEIGSLLITHRVRLFNRLEKAMDATYSELAQDGPLESHYVTSWERDGIQLADGDPREAMEEHLSMKKVAERSRKTTLTGPHRDDMVFRIGGREARAFGSQGQQRTIALSWKLAEVAVITEIAAQRPILLLDDVMSELDEKRRHALAAFAGSVAQTVMTTTNRGYFDEELLERAKVITL